MRNLAVSRESLLSGFQWFFFIFGSAICLVVALTPPLTRLFSSILLPLTLRPLLSNGLLVGILLAVLMDNLIPWNRLK